MTLRRKGRPIALKTHFPASRGFLASLHASLVGGTRRRETTQVRDARNPFNRPEKDPESELQLLLELRKLIIKEKEIDNRLREKEIDCNLEIRKLEEETNRMFRLKELELTALSHHTQQLDSAQSHDFDVGRYTRFIPVFHEKDVDNYFILFERVATTLKWPKNMWTVMLQCVLTGKAQEVYDALSEEVSLDYEQVKVAILRAYELVPEAYRQRFRGLKKNDCQAYVEFAREKEVLFERWCSSTGVKSLEDLKALLLMEELKKCLPDRVATYLNEQKPIRLSDAAVLADEYVLTHKAVFSERGGGHRPGLWTTTSEKPQSPLTCHGSPAGQDMLRKNRGR